LDFKKQAIERLSSVTDNPVLEVDLLLSHVLQQSRSYLYRSPQILTEEQKKYFDVLIERRLLREPIAYLIGHKECWSLPFIVTRDTLVPRPETECLIEYILMHYDFSPLKLADLGTGCGTIGLSIAHERPSWKIVLTDQSEQALQVAKENAKRFHLDHVVFAEGNWCDALEDHDFDIIVSNPPYIALTEWPMYEAALLFEPREALVSGEDGLQAIREIIRTAKKYLKSSGLLLIEHGFNQGELVRELLMKAGYQAVNTMRDLGGHERATTGSLKK